MNKSLIVLTTVLLSIPSLTRAQTPNPKYVENAAADIRVRLWGHVYNANVANPPSVSYALAANLTHNSIGEHERYSTVDGMVIWDDTKDGLYIEEANAGPQAWDNDISRFRFEAHYEAQEAGPLAAIMQKTYVREVPADKSPFALPGHRALRAYGDESYIYESTPDTVYVDVGVTYSFCSDQLLDENGDPILVDGNPAYGDQYGTVLKFSLFNFVTNQWEEVAGIDVGQDGVPFSGTLDLGAHQMLVIGIDRNDEYVSLDDQGSWRIKLRFELGDDPPSAAVRTYTLTPWTSEAPIGQPNGGNLP